MLSCEPRAIALTLLSLAAVAAGSAVPARSDEPKVPLVNPPSTAAKADDANPTPPPGRMFVVGRVLDPTGKPVAGAAVMVHARNLAPGRAPFTSRSKMTALANSRADGSGRFRIDAPRTSATRQEDFGAVALAPGYGVRWVELDPDDDQPTADISLRPEQVIHGRLFDLQGRPVPDVRVSVMSISSDVVRARAEIHQASVHRRIDGVLYGDRAANDFLAWPRPVTTDSEGRFTMRGVGQNLQARLIVSHPRFAHDRIEVKTDDPSGSTSLTAALVPPQILNVRVTYADTGQPVPRAPLQVLASRGNFSLLDESETDAEGKARINSYPADRAYGVYAYPPEGQPYLITHGSVVWPKGALEQTLNIALPRGVLVHGRVTEEGSGKPIAGAMVDFEVRRELNGNNHNSTLTVYSQPDGSFRLGAEPEAGHLFVRGPDDDYVLQSIDSGIVLRGRPGGSRLYLHAYAALDLKPGMASQEINPVLRRSATVVGRVVGPDGQPVRNAWIFTRLILDPSRETARYWTGSYHGKVSNGRFAIRGLAADAEVPVYFLEPERKLGAAVNLSVKSAAGGPVTVRLEPCGSARGSLVDSDGNPIARPVRELSITMIVTPGPARNNFPNPNDKTSLPAADEYDLTTIDPINYEKEQAPDAVGRITLPVLIPGATYRFIDSTMFVRGQTGPEIRKEFTVKPGQKVLLGEIRIAKPPR